MLLGLQFFTDVLSFMCFVVFKCTDVINAHDTVTSLCVVFVMCSYYLVYVCMVISGIGTLMPWNMFITATAVSAHVLSLLPPKVHMYWMPPPKVHMYSRCHHRKCTCT